MEARLFKIDVCEELRRRNRLYSASWFGFGVLKKDLWGFVVKKGEFDKSFEIYFGLFLNLDLT